MTNLIQTNNQMTLKTVDDFYSKIRANLTLHMKTFLTYVIIGLITQIFL